MTPNRDDRAESVEERLLRLERLFTSAYAAAVAAVLVVAFAFPFATREYDDGDVDGLSVATRSAAMLAGRTSDRPLDTVAGVAFVALAVVIWLIVLVVVPLAATRRLDGWRLLAARILIGLGVAGTLVPMGFGEAAAGGAHTEFAWGGVILLVGMIAAARLVVPSVETLVGSPVRNRR